MNHSFLAKVKRAKKLWFMNPIFEHSKLCHQWRLITSTQLGVACVGVWLGLGGRRRHRNLSSCVANKDSSVVAQTSPDEEENCQESWAIRARRTRRQSAKRVPLLWIRAFRKPNNIRRNQSTHTTPSHAGVSVLEISPKGCCQCRPGTEYGEKVTKYRVVLLVFA